MCSTLFSSNSDYTLASLLFVKTTGRVRYTQTKNPPNPSLSPYCKGDHFPPGVARSLADAEVVENLVEEVLDEGFAEQAAQVFERGVEIDGDEVFG